MCSTTNNEMRKAPAASSIAQKLEQVFLMIRRWPPAAWIVIAVALCATEVLEVLDFTLALVGAGGYMMFQYLNHTKRVQKKVHEASSSPPYVHARGTPRQDLLQPSDSTHCAKLPWRKTAAVAQLSRPAPVVAVPTKLFRQPSSAPVQAPTFVGVGWKAEVQELQGQLAVTPECEEAVRILAQDVERLIKRTIPGVEAAGFVFGNPLSSKAFGVAVPEIDIVITISDGALLKWSQREFPGGGAGADIHKSVKSAVRACTDQLVSSCGFKFRRSAFRGEEPKVTLLAPVVLGGCNASVPTDIYVNAMTPLRSWTLLSDCAQLDVRAQELVLLVRRWARDRGVSHVAKGHMSPYAWSLLAIFFLQVARDESSQLLPPIAAFPKSSRLALGGKRAKIRLATTACCQKTAADLFKEFFSFFATEFDWHTEAASVRQGLRAAVEGLGARRAFRSDDACGPCVQDPFDISRNVGTAMTGDSIVRLREELRRAHELCARDASLAELLQPWAPPEREDVEENDHLQYQATATRGNALVSKEAARPGSLTALPQMLAPRVGAKVAAAKPGSLTALPEVLLAPRVGTKVVAAKPGSLTALPEVLAPRLGARADAER